jgi:hypothetical protein
VIDRIDNPVDKAQLLILMYLIYRIGPLSASMAVLAGAPMKSVYAVHNLMIMALAMEAEKVCVEWEIGRFAFTNEPGIFNPIAPNYLGSHSCGVNQLISSLRGDAAEVTVWITSAA